jgi:hypothetical protein
MRKFAVNPLGDWTTCRRCGKRVTVDGRRIWAAAPFGIGLLVAISLEPSIWSVLVVVGAVVATFAAEEYLVPLLPSDANNPFPPRI